MGRLPVGVAIGVSGDAHTPPPTQMRAPMSAWAWLHWTIAFASWQTVPVGGAYCSIAGVRRDGDSYKLISLGSAQLAPTLTAREQLPGVSAALDRGRAGLLRKVGDGGDSLLAYETVSPEDALQSEIRVQSLSWYPSAIPGIDGSGAPPETSLADLDQQLAPE